eukprot:TRINITY_DN13244_c0_g1_i1.p1 TRINITY_DN13244_c0_g1~~TRINITY_DN13244_c0_g1_i1.p1  ORF type:complete len:572 (-),score=192.32 TRINITY_DN13244_c0_g1_i1:167-1882(-)
MCIRDRPSESTEKKPASQPSGNSPTELSEEKKSSSEEPKTTPRSRIFSDSKRPSENVSTNQSSERSGQTSSDDDQGGPKGTANLIESSPSPPKNLKEEIQGSVAARLEGATKLFRKVSESNKDVDTKEKSNQTIVKEAMMERKQSSLESLYQWEQRKVELLNSIRNILETSHGKLDMRYKYSGDALNNLIRFLRERKKQDEEYYQYSQLDLNKLGHHVKQHPSAATFFGELGQAFVGMDDIHADLAKKVQAFAAFIENHLLQHIHSKELIENESRLSQSKERLIAIKKKINALNKEYYDRYNKVMKNYPNTKFDEIKKDLMAEILKIIHTGKETVKMHIDLGHETVNFWNFTQAIEIERFRRIKTVMKEYLEKFSHVYGSSAGVDQSMKSIEGSDVETLTTSHYAVEAILAPQDVGFIRTFIENKDTLTMEDLKNFFNNFVVDEFHEQNLVRKKMKVEQVHIAEGQKSLGASDVVITLDNHLLVSENKNNVEWFRDPAIDINIHSANFRIKKEHMVLEILESKSGFLLETMQEIKLQFKNMDDLEEFCYYFSKIKSYAIQPLRITIDIFDI